MVELIAFVRAQLDEDERMATEAKRYWHGVRIESATMAEEMHAYRWDPARVLAEVEAKRRIVDDAEQLLAAVETDEFELRVTAPADHYAAVILPALAQPYAGRPGWREEWRA